MKWSLVAQVLNVATTVVTTAVLARLLDPATWGLVSMALVILRFGQYFARMGVGSALVQKPELTDDDIRAGFVSSVLLGAAVCVVVVVVAPFTHFVFKNPQVVPVARVMSLTFILDGAAITSGALLQRRLKFKVFAWMDTASYVVGYGGIAIVLAVLGYGVWSLVIAGLAQSAITAVLYYAATRHPAEAAVSLERVQTALLVRGPRLGHPVSRVHHLQHGHDVGRTLLQRWQGWHVHAIVHPGELPNEYLGQPSPGPVPVV